MNRIDELIQREIDDDLAGPEQAELLTMVASDPALRAQRDRMQSLGHDLDALQWQEPAPELKKRIMAGIAAETPRRLGPTQRPRWRIDRRQILAFAAGVAVMFAAGHVSIPPQIQESEMGGTLLTASGSLHEIDRGQAAVGDQWLRAWTEGDGAHVLVHVQGGGGAEEPVQIVFDDRAWSVISFRGAPAADLALGDGRAEFVRSESGSFTLEMELQLRETTTDAGHVRVHIGSVESEASSIRLGTLPD